MGGINSGRRASTPSTKDCLRLSLTDLRKGGALKRHVWARREQTWVDTCTKREVAAVTIVADIDCRQPTLSITIKGWAFNQRIDQVLDVVAQPQPLGGERFYALCPFTGQRGTALYLPVGANIFASARGWCVPYASTREREVARAYRRLHRAEERLFAMSKYTRKPTRSALENRMMEAADVVGRWEEQMMAHW
ncbi:MAG: hypothetical protein O9266_04345 [Porphyrobacter sp.]|nr:hypothetical protein [Porphyrobacter sp.]